MAATASTSSQTAVGRIARLASTFVLDTLPRPPASTVFEDTNTTRVRCSSDPGSILVRNSVKCGLQSLLVSSPRDVLPGLIPHIPALEKSPIVIHVAVTNNDLADALALRLHVPFVLYSSTPQQAHDQALLASRLASSEKKTVVHIFHPTAKPQPQHIIEVETEKVLPFIQAGPHHPASNGYANGTNGHVNGTTGHANGVNGHEKAANGHAGNETPHSPGSPTTQNSNHNHILFNAYESAGLDTLALVRRAIRPITYTGPSNPTAILVTLGQAVIDEKCLTSLHDVGSLSISLLSPLPPSKLLARIPPSVERIIILEQITSWPTKYTPLFLDVISSIQHREPRPYVVQGTLGPLAESAEITAIDIKKLISKATPNSSAPIHLGPSFSETSLPAPAAVEIPAYETAYTKILSTLFGDNLTIENAPDRIPIYGDVATRPDFALGRVQVELEERDALVQAVQTFLQDSKRSSLYPKLSSVLTKWLLSKDDVTQCNILAEQILPLLPEKDSNLHSLYSRRRHFSHSSRWIIGSDAWSYDLGASGLHHLLSSKANVNLLLLDTTPYTLRDASPATRKKDAGLYAMNHGDVYVASVAVYSSYGQVLQALAEADKFNGPSVVLAYLPYEFPSSPAAEPIGALDVLKETKLAVDAGYWPLYRWNPAKERRGEEPFSLDSEAIKADLEAFLDRQNHLSQLVRNTPELASEIVGSLGENLKESRRKKAQESYDALLNALDGPPLLVLYASDGGAAEKMAKRLAARAKTRGLASRVQTFDSFPFADLAKEPYIAFVTSTAGQGEPPQNGRDTFKAINAAVAKGEKILSGLKYAVFGLGDSRYWPRGEDKHYYNRPGKDLDTKLALLGAERVAEPGFGDDQDADGPQTGYKIWEPLVWKALGVDNVEIVEAEPETITNEHIKIASNFLRGTIAEGLLDTSTGALAPTDGQVTKFHGIYEQDDRDIRDERKEQGLEPAYAFMVRVRMPGGVCTPAQWLAMDRIADERGNSTLKLTTRQTFQFHGVIKRHLKPSIQAINRALLDTIAACGDVNRNVLCSSMPPLKHIHEEMYMFAKKLSEKLKPRTTAYHEIWLDKKMVAGDAVKDFEPMYGAYYLPRKFKIAVACPPHNDVDVFANDVGFIAIPSKDERHLLGFNVTAGGGMGVTHSNKKTYPRLGDVLGFVTVEQAYVIAEAILTTQRDNGNRQDRKNARLKYTIDRMGLDTFKAEVERRAGFKFEPTRPFEFNSNVDYFGWQKGLDNKHHFTAFIENGRVQDEPGKDFKTAIREIAKVHKGTFRLTCNQHLIIADVPEEEVPRIKVLLKKYKLDNLEFSGLRLSSSACVAFPTCGLAMAESERYLPILIDKVEKICEENGLRNDSIVMRMTGCPNGCARPYVAEVAFVGKSPGVYVMLLGGGYYGQRLNKIYRESVTEPEILNILRPMIKRYALERLEGERFGDFTIRAGYIAPTSSGKEWYDRAGGEGEYHVDTA